MTQSTQDAIEVFRRHYGGAANFLTPEILQYGWAGPYAFEVAWGRVMGAVVFGVTFLSADGETQHDLNLGGVSLLEVRKRIVSLIPETGNDAWTVRFVRSSGEQIVDVDGCPGHAEAIDAAMNHLITTRERPWPIEAFEECDVALYRQGTPT